MKTLIEGLFPPQRLLAYIRDFLVFEQASDDIVKKGAKYHQFFAVQAAVEKAVKVAATPDERRIGVIWHTTGSGKSLSMAFLIGLVQRQPELDNPTFVIQVDRTDLDDQLHDQFVAARSLVGRVKHAKSTDQLREMLRTSGGEVIFTTIEKFRLKQTLDGEKQLLRREIRRRERKNLAQARSFKDLLEETLRKYHNRLIEAIEVIEKMIQIRQELESQDQRAAALGLEEDELAFYDAIAKNVEDVYDHALLAPLIHDVVQTIKRNLKVDWTEGHREDVQAAVRGAVKRVLIRKGVQRQDFDKIVPFVMEQATAAYRDWPLVA